MKKIIFLLILLPLIANGQELKTHNDSLAAPYIPTNSTTIKFLNINFHFFIHPTLKGNFDSIDDNYENTTEPYSAYDFVNGIIDKANYYLSHNEVMFFQLPNKPIPCISDSKIRLVNKGVYFHYDTNLANLKYNIWLYPSQYAINPNSEVNVYFYQKNGDSPTAHTWPSGIRHIVVNGAWEMYKAHQDLYFADTTGSTFWKYFTEGFYGSTISHESLHDLGLNHTILDNWGNPLRSDADGISDTPSLDDMTEAYGVNYDACRIVGDTMCSNNFMEYAGGKALTPLQLGTAHYYAQEIIPQYINWDLSANADLYIKDSPSDTGIAPSSDVICWNSPDVWIERMNGDTLSNPIGGEQCFVNVRIHNSSKYQTSANNEALSLYWSKAGVDMLWPNDWNGSTFFRCGERRGGFIGSVIIPTIQTKGETIVKILWTPPMPSDYEDCTEFGSDKWHFCLAAKIDGGNDPLNINYSNMGAMTVWNNNFAWKNLTIDDPTIDSKVPGGLIAFSKPLGYDGKLKLRFKAKKK